MSNLGLPLPDKVQESLQANQSAIDDDSIKFPDVARLASIKQVTVTELQDRISRDNPPLILDVREEDEYGGELGHIHSSLLIPLRTLPSKAGELAARKSDEIVVVCRSGVRSSTAATILTALGFEKAGNLKGGMLEWNEAHFPVER
jgi:rhodanese-related sulfurtransferase